MCGATVADIVKGKKDLTGAKILCVYAKIRGRYAVYRTGQRVMIQHADDQDLGAEQRAAIAPLNPLRGQINGLIDGWRQNSNENVSAKAALFDRRVADALVLGLQGHVDHAELHLREIKADVLEERTSPARVNYIVVAATTAMVVILMASIATSILLSFSHEYSPGVGSLLLGTGAGALGALFSTGIAMRTRAILTDLQPAENRADAAVRIGIGAMAGTVLVGLIVTGDVSLTLGDTHIPGTEGDGWIAMAVAGFAAGFLERLVPGLLEGAAIAGRDRSATNPLAGGLPASAVGAGRRPAGASEQHPLGRPTSALGTPGAAGNLPAASETEQAPADVRLAGVEHSEGEASNGSRLPVVGRRKRGSPALA